MTDSHCHLFKEYYDDIDNIINNAMSNGVKKFIVNGYDINSNKEVLELIKRYDNVYGAIGFHPDNCENFSDAELEFLRKNLNNPKIVAVGEIGLDYHYDGFNKNLQIEVFRKQIELACIFNKPIIIHSRDSINDTYNIIKDVPLKKVLHCYSGSVEMANKFIQCGSYLGIGGVLTFKNGKVLKDVVANVDLDNIILETDCPYLTPEPFRKYKNEPKYLINIAKEISHIKNIELGDIEAITEANICSIFDI